MVYKPIQIVAGTGHTILISNKIYVWGLNDLGQLGLGDNKNRKSPQQLSLHNIKSISSGQYHTIALTEDDVLYVWGNNSYGQLDLGDYTNRYTPQELKMSQIKSIVCGEYHTLSNKTFDF